MGRVTSASGGVYTSSRPEESPSRLEPHRLSQGFDNRGQHGTDIKRSVKVLGKMVQGPQVGNFTIRWIGKARFLTSPDLLAAQ